ncbi:MAG: J domain-containing protein [Candidatus Latescibacteria bacterium]|nr:J domain-containing protein [Candidatus Latescibacterota bacterium]
MDLLGRLWRIARAQVGSRRPTGPTPYPPDPEAGEAAGARRPAAPVQDPQLARYYANLELPYGSDLATVRRAWKRLLKQYHPDLHASDPEKRRVANELSAALTQAYQELARVLKEKENS